MDISLQLKDNRGFASMIGIPDRLCDESMRHHGMYVFLRFGLAAYDRYTGVIAENYWPLLQRTTFMCSVSIELHIVRRLLPGQRIRMKVLKTPLMLL